MRCFKVDGHIDFGDANLFQNSSKNAIKLKAVTHLWLPNQKASSQFSKLSYSIGPWGVDLVWPKGWPAPALNSLGWLPKCEFGSGSDCYFNNLNPALQYPIAPFRYQSIDNGEVTPLRTVTNA